MVRACRSCAHACADHHTLARRIGQSPSQPDIIAQLAADGVRVGNPRRTSPRTFATTLRAGPGDQGADIKM